LIFDTELKSFFEETSFVLKADCHVRTELWYFKEVDPLVTDDLGDYHMLRKDLLWYFFWYWDRVSLFIKLWLNSFGFLRLSWCVIEQFVSYTRVRLQNFVNQEIVI